MAATRTPASFTVGWVCALPIELAAAQMIMDEEYEDLPSLPSAANTYTYGRVGIHHVVAACLPAGQTGNSSAAVVAAEMRHTFPSMRFAILVGIGGGVPTQENDIRLGDVVISQPTGQYGGVVQFDFGKTGRGGQITRTGSLNAPPRMLLTALSKLRANIFRGVLHISDHLSVFSSSPVFARPDSEQDVLYTVSSEHVSGPTCVWCKKDDVISRIARITQDPALFFGTIASGNQVMKDAPTRDHISQNLGGVLCFEMEAAGLMNNFPCLVIRGISDYADVHKNNQWQPYAAATAAAYGKELLRIVPQLDSGTINSQNEGANRSSDFAMFSLSKQNIDCLRSLSFREQEYRSQQIVFAKDTCYWLLRNSDYRNWVKKTHGLFWIKGNPGAGKSALMKFAVTAMKNKHPQDLILSFFVHGQGNELQRSPLGVFRALLNSMLTTFPQRLSKLTERFEDRERRFGSYQENRWEWATAELRDLMSEILIEETKALSVTIFVDALDECGEHDAKALLNYFIDLITQAEQEQGRVKICFSSRHYPILWPNTIPTVSVEEQNNMDIHLVIHEKLKQIESQTSRWQIEEQISLKSRGGFQWAILVTDRVVDGDMAGTDEAILHKMLTSVPGTLDELYTDILSSSTRAEKAQIVKLFQWILFAKRPLCSQELREALATDKDMTYETVAQLRQHNRWGKTSNQFEKYVKSLSRGLVEFRTRELWEQHEPAGELWDREAQFIHQSVADYATERFLHRGNDDQTTTQSVAGAGHFEISRSCLRYVTLSDILAGTCLPRGSLSARFPLAPFAVQFLFYHVQMVEQEGIHQLDLLELIHWGQQSESLQQIDFLWKILDPDCAHAPEGWPFIGATQLHVAIAFGSKSAFDAVLQLADTEVNAKDSYGNTPLLLAIRESYPDLALMLLNRSSEGRLDKSRLNDVISCQTQGIEQHGTLSVNVNAENDDKDTALTLAIETGTGKLIRRLIEEGADLSHDGQAAKVVFYAIRHRDKPLLMHLIKQDVELDGAVYVVSQELSYHGTDDVLETFLLELLIAGAKTTRSRSLDTLYDANQIHCHNVDSDDFLGQEDDDDAILVASRRGHFIAVKLLLSHGSSASHQGRNGQTPLHLASSGKHLEVARLLIKEGADVNMQDRDGDTPLHLVSDRGHLEVAKVLIKEGADLNIQDLDGDTPLHLVSDRGHLEVAKVLIQKGADLNILNNNGETPFESAFDRKHPEVARLLIEMGADLGVATKDGKTPLQSALDLGYLELATTLIQKGIDPNVTKEYQITPLEFALDRGHLQIARLLLEKGANPNGAVKKGRKSLLDMPFQSLEYFVKSTSPDTVDPNRQTPLEIAAKNGQLEVARLLLENGADPHTVDDDGWTPLSLASACGHVEVARLLLQNGADPYTTNGRGYTPLCSASAGGHLEVVRLLLGRGIDPSTESNNGCKLVGIAVSHGHVEIAHLLFENGAR